MLTHFNLIIFELKLFDTLSVETMIKTFTQQSFLKKINNSKNVSDLKIYYPRKS